MENKRFKAVILLLIVIIMLLLVFIILITNSSKTVVSTPDTKIISGTGSSENAVPSEPVINESETVTTEKEIRGTLYFVIDDVGNNLFQLKPFLKLPMNLTFAVLPGLKYTKQCVELIKAAGKDYIIHQPMEALGGQNPGPGALFVGMNQEQVRTIVINNLKDYNGVRGMNNHMGSAGTSDPELMNYLFNVLKEQGMFFLDSKTTAESVGLETAKIVGIPYAERSIFLDNSKEKQSILDAVESGLNVSEKKGHAVMIGHIWTEELADILLELYPSLLENNYVLNNLTELFMGNGFDEDSWD